MWMGGQGYEIHYKVHFYRFYIPTLPFMVLVDSEITVRRKTLFLFNTLLLPPTPSGSPSAPSNDSAEGQNPIHPNSHAAHLHNPSRASTSQLTLDAFKGHGITSAVIAALTNPLPCGEDGEDEGGDVEVEEHGVRFVVFFVESFIYLRFD
jgi:hypothetical protein